jgi:PilZ domain
MAERRESGRRKSFLRGLVYYDSKHGALDCVVRDLSDEGARIIFSENVTLPDRIDLHIPQKNQTLRARVTWRRAGEIGLGFDAAKGKAATTAAPLPEPAELMKRIAQLEGEIAKLQKMLRRMKAERPPHHEDDIVAA